MSNLLKLLVFYVFISTSAKANSINCSIFNNAKDLPLSYAKHFKLKIDEKNKITFIGIRKDKDLNFLWWGLSHNVDNLDKYLANCSSFRLSSFPKRIVSTSTTHLSFIAELGAADQLAGFTQTSMISGNFWQERVKQKKLINLPLTLNVEHFISGKFDALLTYPESSFDDLINSLYKSNKHNAITLFPVVEYLEPKALGRSEWVKFFGALFDQLKLADEIFKEREKNYLNTVKKISSLKISPPKVMLGEILDGKWVYPSLTSDLMDICTDLKLEISRPMIKSKTRKNIGPDFFHPEEMLAIKSSSNFWLLTSAYGNRKDLFSKNVIYKNFSNKKIIALKKQERSEQNFHSYWEEGVNRPDVLITDLAKIFYPDIFAKHKSVWFNELL